MSSVSNIIAFDYAKFENVIIPALKEGASNNLVAEEIKKFVYSSAKFENLDLVMDLFDDKLRQCKFGRKFAANCNGIYETNAVFESPFLDCWTYEDLSILLERIILRHCAKYYLSIGKIYRLGLVTTSFEVDIRNILDRLCNASFVWAHCSADSNGIYGWIDTDEVKKIADNLDKLTTVGDSFKLGQNAIAMNSLKKFIALASKKQLGLLFGNSLSFDVRGNNKYYNAFELMKDSDFDKTALTFTLRAINSSK